MWHWTHLRVCMFIFKKLNFPSSFFIPSVFSGFLLRHNRQQSVLCVLSVSKDVWRMYAGPRPFHVSVFFLEYLQKITLQTLHPLKSWIYIPLLLSLLLPMMFDGMRLERLIREHSLLQNFPALQAEGSGR